MIFYFTGTGNSYDAAKKIADATGDRLVDISEAMKMNQYTFILEKKEVLGFIFPVYYYTIPDIVRNFINNVDIKGSSYTYSVITCGASIGGTGGMLQSELRKKNIKLDYVIALPMPDNAVIFYDVPDLIKVKEILKSSYYKLDNIILQIKNKTKTPIKVSGNLMTKLYHLMNNTKKFYGDEKCIGCGKCVTVCPEQVITLKNGKPEWIRNKCTHCLGCINRCPIQAIQYGKATEKRRRYINPVFKDVR